MQIDQQIASELLITVSQVKAAVNLLDEGATVPFISRYRKELTGGLSDTQLRDLESRLIYLRELDERRNAILSSITEQGKLTEALKLQLVAADTKARLEDLYLPYKPKRHTKAQIAREAGLEPLADSLLKDPTQDPLILALQYVNAEKSIADVKAALEGARHILMERFAEDADLVAELRQYVWEQGLLASEVQKDQEEKGVKFKDYFNFQEPLNKIPSHRTLAILRGQKENILRAQIIFSEEEQETVCIQKIARQFGVTQQERLADAWLWQTIDWTWKIKLKSKIDLDLIMQLRESAEEIAITVFKDNLKHLLMAAPAGKKVTLGLDPGLRTGVKTVVVDDTGKLLAHTVIYPHVPQNDWDRSLQQLAKLCQEFKVNLVSIGNGTASRETERLATELNKRYPELNLTIVVVSEAGASVYSASELAAKEFPELDVSYRGAVSIARRLQDPLAELVKIDPKSIGVGQYQHDLNQYKLEKSLDAVVEDCVNAVGADVNTASVPLLKSIAGLNETIAQNIIQYRETHGRFKNRNDLKQVPRLGEKTYEQAVGFLRIIDGENPLDASAVHPESYPIINQVVEKTQVTVKNLIGNLAVINALNPRDFLTDQTGEITINDIFAELKKPGRDPRPEFKTAKFKEGIETLADLKTGMMLEGIITNVTNFGAFVDIGVHQDGLLHVSQLADRFIRDPNEVVKVGQIVQVKVLEIDLLRKRIQLTMKKGEAHADPSSGSVIPSSHAKKKFDERVTKNNASLQGGFSDLLQKALKK